MMMSLAGVHDEHYWIEWMANVLSYQVSWRSGIGASAVALLVVVEICTYDTGCGRGAHCLDIGTS